MTKTNAVPIEGNVSYIINYETVSKISDSGRATGTLYLRGVLNADEYTFEKFKFVLEKSVDFCDLDS